MDCQSKLDASFSAEDFQYINKPMQNHHIATNKNKRFTPEMGKITNKYGLKLDESWNKEMLPHLGRHPNAYHEWVLEQMKQIDAMPCKGTDSLWNQQDVWCFCGVSFGVFAVLYELSLN